MADSGSTETPYIPDNRLQGIEDLEAIIERHLPWIHAHVRKKLGGFLRSKDESGDFVQEAMVQFLKYGPRIRFSNDNQLRALLCRIVENVICNKHAWLTAQRRTIARERPLPADTVLYLDPPHGTQETPSQIAQENEDEAWARLALELLEPEEREVIILHFWKDKSFAEIGKILGISKTGASKRYTLAFFHLLEKVEALQSGRIEDALGQSPLEDNEK